MPKVAFIGAGSVVFARNLTVDLLGFDALRDTTELVLMDIDEERRRTSETVAQHVARHFDSSARIVATTDRRAALEGADDVVTMLQVGGYKPATVTDFDVPKRFGLRQTIADTLGVGRRSSARPACRPGEDAAEIGRAREVVRDRAQEHARTLSPSGL